MHTIHCPCGETYFAEQQHSGGRIICRRCRRSLAVGPTGAPSPEGWTPGHAGPRRRLFWPLMAGGSAVVALVGVVAFVVGRNHPGVSSPAEESWIAAPAAPPALSNSDQPRTLEPGPAAPAVGGDTFARDTARVGHAAAAECPSERRVRPASSAELGGHPRGGFGRLTLANGTSFDAAVVLTNLLGRRPVRAIYVRHGERGVMTRIPPGRYQVSFELGESWLASRRFCNPSAMWQFEEAFDFEEVRSDSGVTYAVFEVSLNPVPGGTAHTRRRDLDYFVLPPQ